MVAPGDQWCLFTMGGSERQPQNFATVGVQLLLQTLRIKKQDAAEATNNRHVTLEILGRANPSYSVAVPHGRKGSTGLAPLREEYRRAVAWDLLEEMGHPRASIDFQLP